MSTAFAYSEKKYHARPLVNIMPSSPSGRLHHEWPTQPHTIIAFIHWNRNNRQACSSSMYARPRTVYLGMYASSNLLSASSVYAHADQK
jgi:hypothetical protein